MTKMKELELFQIARDMSHCARNRTFATTVVRIDFNINRISNEAICGPNHWDAFNIVRAVTIPERGAKHKAGTAPRGKQGRDMNN